MLETFRRAFGIKDIRKKIGYTSVSYTHLKLVLKYGFTKAKFFRKKHQRKEIDNHVNAKKSKTS